MSFDFAGKSVVLTGGASGIGLAVLKKFLKSGAAVTVGDYADAQTVKSALDSVSKEGLAAEKVTFLHTDVSQLEDNEKLFQAALEKHGVVDIVCANAGIGDSATFINMTLKDWRRVHSVNLDGTFMLNNLAVKHWVANNQPGVIVNTSSIAGLCTLPDLAGYSSTKAGINSLTKSICKDFAAKGIRANTVNPGFIRTPIYHGNEEMLNEVVKLVPQGTIGEADDIADAVLFLASDSAKYINGHCLAIDGGASN